MSLFDSIMSDTVGVLYRAASGNVDPWTKQEVIDSAVQDCINAGGDSDSCAENQQQLINDTLDTFTLGGDDRTGSQGVGVNLPSSTSLSDTAKSAFNDNGSGCGITNLGGCYPSWLPYAAIAVGVLALLWVTRPYIELLEES